MPVQFFRRELLKKFAEATAPLQRIHQHMVWQIGNHPVELTTSKMINRRLNYTHFVTGWRPAGGCIKTTVQGPMANRCIGWRG